MNTLIRLPRFFTVVIALVLLSGAATVQAAYSISQRHIYYYSDLRSVSVRVSNTGDDTREYTVKTPYWDDKTRETDAEMIAYPPVFSLKPGEQQTVRLLLRNKNQFTAPLFYRLVVTENDPVTQKAASKASNSLSIPISTSFPVYYIDKQVEPQAKSKLLRDKQGRVAGLWVHNTGETLLSMRKVIDAQGNVYPTDVRVLPGRAHTFKLAGQAAPFTIKVAYGSDLVVR